MDEFKDKIIFSLDRECNRLKNEAYELERRIMFVKNHGKDDKF